MKTKNHSLLALSLLTSVPGYIDVSSINFKDEYDYFCKCLSYLTVIPKRDVDGIFNITWVAHDTYSDLGVFRVRLITPITCLPITVKQQVDPLYICVLDRENSGMVNDGIDVQLGLHYKFVPGDLCSYIISRI